MSNKRKLSDEEELTLALIYLCGCVDYFKEEGPVSYSTVRLGIISNRSRNWNNPLIELYKSENTNKRKRNSAHLKLVFHGRDVKHKELVDLKRDRPAYSVVNRVIYNPFIYRVAEDGRLRNFFTTNNGLEELITSIFGQMTARRVIEPLLLDRLEEEYMGQKSFSLSKVFNDTEKLLFYKIKEGGLGITPKKAQFIYEALNILSEQERSIIMKRFGIFGMNFNTLEEVGREYGITRESIRIKEKQALTKLRRYLIRERGQIITGAVLDDEVEQYLARMRRRQNSQALGARIEEIDLSYRTYRSLFEGGLRTTKQIQQRTDSELLGVSGIGSKSLLEIREKIPRYN